MPDDRPDDRPEPSIAGTAHYREAAGRDHHGPNYRGLPVLSFPGLHDHVRTLAQRHFPQEASVLDLGCGSGALSLRLADAGFRMSCADAVGEAFRLRDEMPFTAVDLNRDFAPIIGGIFPAITAVEIIEHLENPRHFLRQCRALLQPGGCLILTTPNIDNLRSVLSFVKTGCFKYFDDNAHRKDGHISPLSQWQLEKAFGDTQFDILSMAAFGAPWGPGLRHLGAKALNLLTKKNPRSGGVITVACLRRPAD